VAGRTISTMRRMSTLALLCLTTAGLGQNRLQQGLFWKPPRVLRSEVLPHATVPKEMIGSLRVSGLNIVLEETEMKKAQARFGGTFGGAGDAGDSLEWLCLRGLDAAGQWVLWLESGEIDAGRVGSIQWRRVRPESKFDQRCAVLSGSNPLVELPLALRVGLLESDVLRILGKPTVRDDDTLVYVYEHKRRIKGEEFTEINVVSVVIRDRSVWAIEAQKSTTS
jgi:hypothetical protein